MVFPIATAPVPLPSAFASVPGGVSLTERTRITAHPGAECAAEQLADAIQQRCGIRPTIGVDGEITVRHDAHAPAESHTITVGERAELTGDAAGLFHAAQSVRQLIVRDGDGWVLPGVQIDDAARFAHRGFMLDVARTFFPVETVLAVIDRIAALKFNRLHLHLTDDQGWRLQIHSRPLLTERAAGTSACGRPGGFYTQDAYRRIVEYAAERHIEVIPEIDLPGHTHAIGLAYPHLVEAPVHDDALRALSARFDQALPEAGVPYQGWGVGHSSVRIGSEQTYEFIADVLGELAAITPGEHLHIGGDEALGTPQSDFNAFVTRVTGMVAALGKTPIAWHEAGTAEVSPGTVGQFWGSRTPTPEHAANTGAFVRRGGSVILSPNDTAYLDMQPAPDFPLGLDWAGTTDLRRAYDWEPTAVLPGVPEAAILGVEAPLWAETVSSLDDIDQLVFPRAAAIAEVAWSPADSRDWESFRARVARLGGVWDAAGWGGHRPAEIPWSTR